MAYVSRRLSHITELTTLDLAIWPKLELSLERAHSEVANPVARHHVLYRRLGLDDARLDAL